MSSCCGPKTGEEGSKKEKAADEAASHGHEHQGGCCGTGVGMGFMRWVFLGLLVVVAFSYLRSL